MKNLFLVFLVSVIGAFAFAKDVYVNGYTKKNGTYVQPHYRSAPDGNNFNNYSTKGNINPYTGKEGTVDPYGSNNGFDSSSGSGSSFDSGSED